MRAKYFLGTAFVALLCVMNCAAADLPQPSLPDGLVSVQQALMERVSLLLVRQRFDVLSSDDVSDILVQDATRFETSGIQASDEAAVQNQLMAEGSYFIVSLQYLIGSGGANWPIDKAASVYDQQASTKLADLQARWFAAVKTHGDLLSILREIDQVDAETDGQTAATGDHDHFAGAEALVESALASVLAAT
jgi:hypothetical protein